MAMSGLSADQDDPASAQRPRSGLGSGRLLLRLGLPIAALVLVTAVFFLTSRADIDAPAALSIDGVAIGSGLEVTKPRFLGETEDGETFQVTADSAQPDGPDPDKIKLQGVKGDVGLPEGRSLNASAKDGLFKPKERWLRLEGGVIAETSDGYAISSETIDFDLETRSGETQSTVRLKGPMGELTADRMKAQFDGDFVATFSGGVKIVITRMAEKDAQ